ncbi:MAG: GAF domain-containing protein [Phycisphaerales bacterium]|nr:GAF domain-containing protein [Phycisphaerales bacterium]
MPTSAPPPPSRNYTPVLQRLRARGTRDEVMRAVVNTLWDQFHAEGVSWVGFYTVDPTNPEHLVLGPRRDKPACSPIELHGACGRCFTSRRPLVVTDVAKLGAGYIACDPRDRSEVVVPVFNPGGSVWGVLDVDSHDTNAFDVADAMALMRMLRHVALSAHLEETADDVVVV